MNTTDLYPFSKPCARPLCQTPVVDDTPKHFARKKYCSKRCAARHRIANGWQPQRYIMDPAVHAKAVRLAGKACGVIRRKRRALAVLDGLSRLLTPLVLRDMEARQLAAFKAALVRAYLQGRRDEQGRRRSIRRNSEKRVA